MFCRFGVFNLFVGNNSSKVYFIKIRRTCDFIPYNHTQLQNKNHKNQIVQ